MHVVQSGKKKQKDRNKKQQEPQKDPSMDKYPKGVKDGAAHPPENDVGVTGITKESFGSPSDNSRIGSRAPRLTSLSRHYRWGVRPWQEIYGWCG